MSVRARLAPATGFYTMQVVVLLPVPVAVFFTREQQNIGARVAVGLAICVGLVVLYLLAAWIVLTVVDRMRPRAGDR